MRAPRFGLALAPAAMVALLACGDAPADSPTDGDTALPDGGGLDAPLDARPDSPAGGDAALSDGGGLDAVIDASPVAEIPYDRNGPVPYDSHVEHVVNGGQSFDVTVYLPGTPGLHPVVSLSCGTSQTAAGYVPYAERLASYGIAMFLMDDPGVLTNTSDIVPNAVYVVDTWLPATFGDTIDVSKVGLAGHSRGGGVSLLAAERLGNRVVAWFGLDPVDNEFLMNPRDFARTDLPGLAIPTGFLGAGVTSNCAPPADSYQTLFPLAPSPSVLVVGIGAGHTQLEAAGGCTACAVCAPAGTADSDAVLAYAVRYFTAFFARELLGDTSVGAHFEGAGGPEDIAAGRVTIM